MSALPAPVQRATQQLLRHGSRLSLATLVLLCVAMAIWLLREGRELIFFYDDWSFLLDRRHGVDTLFEDYNGHLSLVPLGVYRVLFETVGVEPYWVYRVVSVVLHLLCVGMLYEIVRRRAGWALALPVATAFLALGSAWQVVLWPGSLSFQITTAAGLGALLALDRRTRAGDLLAAALVLVALASSGTGLAVAVGVFAGLLADPRRRRAVWVSLAPLAIFGLWYLVQSPTGQAEGSNLQAVPGYVADAGAAAVGAVTGLGAEWGRIGLVALVAAVVLRLVRTGPVPARLIGLVAAAGTYWGATALGRAELNEPGASRYLYFGAVLVLLVLVELVRGSRMPPRAWPLVAVGVSAAALANLGDLRDGASSLRDSTERVRAALAATELAGPAVPADVRVEQSKAPQISAGAYRKLVADLGSPIGGPAAVLDDGPLAVLAVDASLARILGVAPGTVERPAVGGPAPTASVIRGRTAADGPCLRYTPDGPGAALDVPLAPGGTLVLRAATGQTEVRVRRLSPEFGPAPAGTLGAGGAVRISVPQDAISRPWVVRVSTLSPVSACSGPAA